MPDVIDLLFGWLLLALRAAVRWTYGPTIDDEIDRVKFPTNIDRHGPNVPADLRPRLRIGRSTDAGRTRLRFPTRSRRRKKRPP